MGDLYKYSVHTTDKKALSDKVINKTHFGDEHEMMIRERVDKKHRYEVYVKKIGDKYNYLYSQGQLTASAVVRVSKKFNISLV